MNNKLLFSCWINLVSICPAQAEAAGERVLLEVFREKERMAMLDSPRAVDVCILVPKEQEQTKSWREQTYTEGDYKTMPSDSVNVLVGALTVDASYKWDAAKFCIPVFNARVRFSKGGHILLVDFAFECAVIRLTYDGQRYSGGAIDGANERIFKLLEALFPHDQTIRRQAAILARRQGRLDKK